MCISMMCPKGSISGLRVKVTTELVRLSGLLFYPMIPSYLTFDLENSRLLPDAMAHECTQDRQIGTGFGTVKNHFDAPLHVSDQVQSPSTPGSAKSSTACDHWEQTLFRFQPCTIARLAPQILANQVNQNNSCSLVLEAHNNTAN